MIWALDASVAVKWFFTDEPRRERALAVREALALHPGQFVVPHLFMSELVHVLARKSGRDGKFLHAAMPMVLRLGMRTIGLDEEGWKLAARWACKGLSGYDATYVALAAGLGGRWLTDDAAAARKVKNLAVALDDWRAA